MSLTDDTLLQASGNSPVAPSNQQIVQACGAALQRKHYVVRQMCWLQKIPRRILNLPAKLIFPAAPKLLGAQNARAYAVQKIKPYLIKVVAHCKAP